MYKDKAKQKEANRLAKARQRAKENAVIPKCWCCGNVIPEGTVCCGPCAWSGRAKTSPDRPKTKIVETYADLPPDIKSTIEYMSRDTEDKAKRIERAIKYQQMFPDSSRLCPHAAQVSTGGTN